MALKNSFAFVNLFSFLVQKMCEEPPKKGRIRAWANKLKSTMLEVSKPVGPFHTCSPSKSPTKQQNVCFCSPFRSASSIRQKGAHCQGNERDESLSFVC